MSDLMHKVADDMAAIFGGKVLPPIASPDELEASEWICGLPDLTDDDMANANEWQRDCR